MENIFLPLGCVILASGSAQRFGSNKLLADFNGQPLIHNILQVTQQLFQQRVVVTRYEKIAQLCEKRGIAYILHNKPYLNDTVRLGMAFFERQELDGYLFAASDQPFLRQASIKNLCAGFCREPQYIHRLACRTTPGNPIIFPAALAGELKNLPQDRGGGFLAKKYPERVRLVQVQDEYELFDIDTMRDLRQAFNLPAERCSAQ